MSSDTTIKTNFVDDEHFQPNPSYRLKFYLKNGDQIISPFSSTRIPPTGIWMNVNLPISMCKHGFHTPTNNRKAVYAWSNIRRYFKWSNTRRYFNLNIHAASLIKYKIVDVVALVEVKGVYKLEISKECWEYMKVIGTLDISIIEKNLHMSYRPDADRMDLFNPITLFCGEVYRLIENHFGVQLGF